MMGKCNCKTTEDGFHAANCAAGEPSPDKDGRTAIEAQPPVGAYLCDSTESYARYWLNSARETPRIADKLLFAEQAINGWKNLAYDLARQAHYYLKTQAHYAESHALPNRELEALAAQLEMAYGDLPKDRAPGPPTSIVARLREIASMPSTTPQKTGETPRADAIAKMRNGMEQHRAVQKLERESADNLKSYQVAQEIINNLTRELADANAQIALDTGNIERMRAAGEDANSAAAHYVRDEPDITPRRAIVRQAAEIERLKRELAEARRIAARESIRADNNFEAQESERTPSAIAPSGWTLIPSEPNGAMLGLIAGEYLEKPFLSRDQAKTLYNAILAQAKAMRAADGGKQT